MIRSLPTSRGLSTTIGTPVRMPGSTMTRGTSAKCAASISRHALSTAGTVEQTATPVTRVLVAAPAARAAAHPTRRRCGARWWRPASPRRPRRPRAARGRCGRCRCRRRAGSRLSPSVVRKSSPRSNTLTEWVSAPTEMKSTPVSATSRARSRVSPPDASRVAWPPAPALMRTASAIVGGRHVVEQDLGAARGQHGAQLVEVHHLDLDPQAGVGGHDRLVRRHHATGGDRRGCPSPSPGRTRLNPVVDATAAAHGVLLQRAPARAGSCGCRGRGHGCRRAPRPTARSRSRHRRGGRRS